jgi:hypothetical protein
MPKLQTFKYKNTFVIFSFLALSILFSFYFRQLTYYSTDFANGWDSYFYLIQLKSYIESGEMHSSDLSLIYPLMIGIQHFTGDYINTFKLTICLLATLLTLTSFLIGVKLTKSFILALTISALIALSPHLTYFASQYPKNLVGFIFLFIFLLSIPFRRTGKSQNRITKYILPSSFILLNYFGHRMTFILSIALTIIFLIIQKSSPKIISGLLLGFLLFIGLGTAFPGLLSIADIERFDGILASTPQFAPYSFWQTFGENRISTIWKWEIVCISISFFFNIIVGFYSLRNPSENTTHKHSQLISLSLTAICILLIFPFFTWSLDGIAYRAFLVFMLIVPTSFFLNLHFIFSKKYFYSYKKSIHSLAWSVIILFSILNTLSLTSYNPKQHDPPYKLYAKVSERITRQIDTNELELLICHKSLAEYFTFTTGIDALPWLPEYKIEKQKLWRVASDIPNHKIQQYLTQSNQQKTKKLSTGYHLVREDIWQLFLVELQKNNETELLYQLETWKNPNRIRPSYLLKGKK